jgi:hypothetical protein
VHVKIIEEATSILSDEDAAAADEKLAEAAQSRTYEELRRAAARLVLKLDPEAVRKRKDKARRAAHVRAFREESGNAGITGRELPSVEVLASMQHVEDRARALRELPSRACGQFATQPYWRRVIAELGTGTRHITYDERARGKSRRSRSLAAVRLRR